MVSSVISFRVSGELLEWLESERHDDLNESLGEAARRLLNRNICKPSVDIVDEQISDPIFDRFEQIEVRLSKLEQSSDFGFSEGAKQLTIFDALEEVEASLKSSGALDGFSI